jgi:hypothetical protein
MCEDWRTGNIGIRCTNPLTLKDAFTFCPMSADQYKQIGIRRGATSINMKNIFSNKQNENFEKLEEFKGQSEKFKN